MNIPCNNCITLPICVPIFQHEFVNHNNHDTMVFYFSLKALSDHCSIFKDYYNIFDHINGRDQINNEINQFWIPFICEYLQS